MATIYIYIYIYTYAETKTDTHHATAISNLLDLVAGLPLAQYLGVFLRMLVIYTTFNHRSV